VHRYVWSMYTKYTRFVTVWMLFMDAIRCIYKATFLFTALFRSMTHFRKSIKSRLVLSGTRSTDISLWETGLNDSHVGSTATRRSCPTVPLLNIKHRIKNSQNIMRFTRPQLLLKADQTYRALYKDVPLYGQFLLVVYLLSIGWVIKIWITRNALCLRITLNTVPRSCTEETMIINIAMSLISTEKRLI